MRENDINNTSFYNGIPLVPYFLDTSFGLKEFFTSGYGFSRQGLYVSTGNGSQNEGFDAHVQFFNQNKYQEECFICYCWPTNDKTPIEKTKTFSYNYSSNGIIPYEQDTGFTVNDPVYDLTVLPGGS